MIHWSDRYVGRSYITDEFDCGDLAALVMREVFKREIHLPQGRLPGAMGRARMIADRRDEFATPIAAAQAVEGDAILIRTRGYDQHIGIVCDIAGESWILHNVSSRKSGREFGQVILTRLRQMEAHGYRLAGFYRWI